MEFDETVDDKPFENSSSNLLNDEWIRLHTLTKEQVAQIILNKVHRAKIYQVPIIT